MGRSGPERPGRLLQVVTASDIAAIVRATPTGAFARRLWSLYEWLTGSELDVPEPSVRLRFTPLVNPEKQVALEYDRRSAGGAVDPVAAAAAAAAGYNPPRVAFPISAAILRRIDEYRAVLESYSAALLPVIDWRAAADGNVEIVGETADYYRYFDATRHAEFLYSCVEQTVEHDLPEEVRFLEAFDTFSSRVKELVEMPDRTLERLHGFLRQGNGHLSQRARGKEFGALTDDEVRRIEAIFQELFAACG